MKKTKILLAFIIMTFVIVISSCANVTDVTTVGIESYGFLDGLWHGLIL